MFTQSVYLQTSSLSARLTCLQDAMHASRIVSEASPLDIYHVLRTSAYSIPPGPHREVRALGGDRTRLETLESSSSNPCITPLTESCSIDRARRCPAIPCRGAIRHPYCRAKWTASSLIRFSVYPVHKITGRKTSWAWARDGDRLAYDSKGPPRRILLDEDPLHESYEDCRIRANIAKPPGRGPAPELGC